MEGNGKGNAHHMEILHGCVGISIASFICDYILLSACWNPRFYAAQFQVMWLNPSFTGSEPVVLSGIPHCMDSISQQTPQLKCTGFKATNDAAQSSSDAKPRVSHVLVFS